MNYVSSKSAGGKTVSLSTTRHFYVAVFHLASIHYIHVFVIAV